MRANAINPFLLIFCLLLTACGSKPSAPAVTATIPVPTAKILATDTPPAVDVPAQISASQNYALPGGLVTALAIDPSTPTTLYGTASGGSIFKSIDGGAHWNLLNAGLPVEDMDVLEVDPFTPANLYAVTENSELYQSRDGGQSWSKSSSLKDSVGRLMLDPVQPGTLYTLTTYVSYYSKSEDSGKSWQAVDLGLPENEFVVDLALDPSKPGTFYIATHDIYNNNESKLYKSVDGGKHWRAIQKGIPEAVIHDLTIDSRKPNTLYVTLEIQNADPSASPGVGNGALYKSTNGGESWFNLGLPASDLVRTLLFTPSALYAVIDQTLFPGRDGPTSGLYKSSDNGQTWSELKAPGDFFFRQNVLAIDPTHPEVFYFAAQDGVFKSIDSGQSWQSSSDGLNAASVDRLVINPAMPSTIYAIYDGGVFKSVDGGKTWRDTHLNTNATGLALDPVTPSTLYAATQEKGMFKSMDGGESWQEINQGLTNLHLRGDDGEHAVLVVDPKNPATLYAGAYAASYHYVDIEGGLFKSVNAGETWSAISGSINRPNVMTINPSDANIWYVGGYEHIFKSTDAGASWSATSFEIVGSATALTMNAKNIYAGTDTAGVFKSSDDGQSWQPVSQGLPNEQVMIQDGTGGETPKIYYAPIAVLTLDPVHPNTLYAGLGGWQHGGGVYRSNDGGQTWLELVDANLPPNTRITDLQFEPGNPNHLYIATYGKGIWSLTLKP